MSAADDYTPAEEARKRVDEFVDQSRDELLALCGALVGGRSANPPGDTRAPVAALQGFLTGVGIPSETVAHEPAKPNLVSVCTGAGEGRHLILNGHLDTIPPGDEKAWTVPIHRLSRRDGRLYGLGIGNMKGAVAGLALAHVFLSRNPDLWRGRVSFTAVADETVFGPDGTGYLLETRPELIGDGLICGEGPGFMELSIAEKGVCWIELVARAPAAQGMLTQRGSSAVVRLAAALAAFDELNTETATPPDEISCLTPHAGEHGLRLTVNVGTIAGGHFVSQVASRAVAEIDFRIPPGLTVADVESRVAAVTDDMPDMEWRRMRGWDPNWTAPNDPLVQSVSRAAAAVRGEAPKPVVRLPASDASRWRAHGVPAVCYGPQPTFAAGTDDYVNEQDVIDCAKVYTLAALAYLNPAR